ncbi:bacterial regulatory s, luxR family protein [Bacillus cereus ATCC 4342]|uniref:response regulator n=1 Tax=Bacillus TaxID=1386 RepID=UPI000308C1D7|nr:MULTISPECIES: response regulator transcription factor [Bacillus cereus group]AJH72227.1 bacterial regulatory s, luxR family protein [Bacillus cereus ATCC 4342]PDY87047.1 DNA-binding response regulator [Bacillus anthracis]AOY14569.1 DNA-binding response regulator [Bacillus sp. ABP14]KFM87979.1 bacterial regulatory s, luxR family protein [Bacillus cereus ATCC 4342]MDR4453737.1 response regulator transcription factor [Bacillus tropicus]
MKYNVLIVDDHFVVREGLKLIIETSDSFQIIGEAANGEEALSFIEKKKPDVILMDLNMPKMSGLETIEALNKKQNHTPIIILTTYNEDELMLQGIELGAKGYLLKDTDRENLFRTLEAAIRGEILLQPNIMEKIVNYKRKEVYADKVEENNLTEKELFVLKAIARGNKNKEIAFDMGIAERTVKAYLTNIYNKLGVNSRSEAVAVSIERKLIHF